MRALLLFVLIAAAAAAQTLSNATLNGNYLFRYVMILTDSAGTATDSQSLIGSISFDGNGGYVINAQANSRLSGPASLTRTGTYTLAPSGVIALTNPVRAGWTLNAKYSPAALTGSTTEATEEVFDLFVAIPAPVSVAGAGALAGTWRAVALEFPGGDLTGVRNSRFVLRPDGSGGLAQTDITGHAANQRAQAIFTETIDPGSYAVNADGTGTATFPGTALLAPSKTILVSRDGSILIGGSTVAGSHDFLIAIRSGVPALTGRFFAAGLRFDGAAGSSFSGAASSDAKGALVWSQRVRQLGAGAIDFSGIAPYSIAADGTGSVLNSWAAATGGLLLASTLSSPSAYEIYFAAQTPLLSGAGVFVNPLGIVNTASYAPAPAPVSPGQFVGLFGSNLAPRTEVAQTAEFPTTLAGVTVSVNGVNAPLYFVSAGQISALIPFGVTGSTATIRVTNGTASNAVEVPLAKSAPGIFTQNQAGTGIGAILKPDFSLVTPQNVPRRGEAILIFLTGLGSVDQPVGDGKPAPSNPLARTLQSPKVFIGGKAATVLYSGLAPGFAGLYQLNVVIPADAPVGAAIALAIETADHFNDQADVPVAP